MSIGRSSSQRWAGPAAFRRSRHTHWQSCLEASQSSQQQHEEVRVTWRLVVANSEVRLYVRADASKTLRRAVLRDTTNVSCALPDNLGEMAPMLEVGHIRLSLAVETGVPADLAVVEQIGDDSRNVVGLNTGSNILTVTASVCITAFLLVELFAKQDKENLHIVRIDAAVGNNLSAVHEVLAPLDIWRGVVGAVNVVVEGGFGSVVSWGRSRSGLLGWLCRWQTGRWCLPGGRSSRRNSRLSGRRNSSFGGRRSLGVLLLVTTVVPPRLVTVVVNVGLLGWSGVVGCHGDNVGNVNHLDVGIGDNIALLIRHSNSCSREGSCNNSRTHGEVMYWMSFR